MTKRFSGTTPTRSSAVAHDDIAYAVLSTHAPWACPVVRRLPSSVAPPIPTPASSPQISEIHRPALATQCRTFALDRRTSISALT